MWSAGKSDIQTQRERRANFAEGYTTKVIGSRELGGPVAWQQALWLCRQQEGSEFYSGAVERIQEAFG